METEEQAAARRQLVRLGWHIEDNSTWEWTAHVGGVHAFYSRPSKGLNLLVSRTHAMLGYGLSPEDANLIALTLRNHKLQEVLLAGASHLRLRATEPN